MPAIVLVDWNMPDGGRYAVQLDTIRWRELPVIFLTVRGDSNDIVSGFRKGADDYVVKPFELEILYSRICALLRRAGNVSGQYLTCDRISLDQSGMMVFLGEEEISLSQPEYQVLLLLMRNKGKTITRERLLEQVWDCNGSFVNNNTLTVTIKRLREKLHQPLCLENSQELRIPYGGYLMIGRKNAGVFIALIMSAGLIASSLTAVFVAEFITAGSFR
ncbi:MAG: response regulator transcription factor [Eisenbergiella sp.]